MVTCIVKVQVPLFHYGDGQPRYLVTSRDRTLIWCEVEIGADDTIDSAVFEEIQETGIKKVYFKATLDNGTLTLFEIVRLPECAQW